MHTNIGSICCIPETNIRLYVNYISIIKTKQTKTKTKTNLIKMVWKSGSHCQRHFDVCLCLGSLDE